MLHSLCIVLQMLLFIPIVPATDWVAGAAGKVWQVYPEYLARAENTQPHHRESQKH